MKKALLYLFITISLGLRAQPSVISYEWFSLSGGFLYSIEDSYTGLNGKINLPLGSHAKFVMQASLFPEQLQNPAESFNELRAKFNVEFIPLKFKKMYLSVQTGFDYGYWKRTFEVQGSTIGSNWKKEESMMFGAIMNYDFKRYRLFIDYMYMPQIFSNHIGIGFSMLFFESQLYRKMYTQRRKINPNKWLIIKNKGKKKSSKKPSNKG